MNIARADFFQTDLQLNLVFSMPWYDENCTVWYAKNVENHAIFVEGFLPEFYARGRFMKYSMSEKNLNDGKFYFLCL